MIKLLEEAIDTVKRLPEHDQEIAAEFLPSFANPGAYRYRLSDQQVVEVEPEKREVREGKIASNAKMDEAWRRFDR